MNWIFPSLLIATVVVAACKPRQQTSSLRDLQEGQMMSDNAALMDAPEMRNKKVVLIYYANDTYAPTDDDFAHVNKEALIDKIRDGLRSPDLDDKKKEKLRRIAARVSDDWNNFRRVVDTDVQLLNGAICRSNPKYQMGLVVFRNFGNDATALSSHENMAYDLERPLNWSYCLPGERPSLATFSVPRVSDFRYQSQPLSHPLVFRRALEEVMKTFPPGAYRYVLITKSHGNAEMAITPHLSRDIRDIPAPEIWRAIISGASDAAGLDSSKGDVPILDEIDSVLVREMPGQQAGRPALPPNPGVSKKDYLQLLYSYGGGDPRLGMYFPIVFMEACKSALQLSTNRDIMSTLESHAGRYSGFKMENIGLLYTSDATGLGYRTIDFQQLFVGFRYNGINDFQDAIRQFLSEKAKK